MRPKDELERSPPSGPAAAHARPSRPTTPIETRSISCPLVVERIDDGKLDALEEMPWVVRVEALGGGAAGSATGWIPTSLAHRLEPAGDDGGAGLGDLVFEQLWAESR